jgi:hypothetical protein
MTLVVAIFYPLIDGGLQQIWTVLKVWKGGKTAKSADSQPDLPSSTEEVHHVGKA